MLGKANGNCSSEDLEDIMLMEDALRKEFLVKTEKVISILYGSASSTRGSLDLFMDYIPPTA